MTRLSAIRDSEKNRNILKSYTETPGLEIVWGDLNNYDDVLKCVKGCDLIFHIAAFVSPAADYYQKQAMKVNYGSTRNIINEIYELGQQERTRLVYIGTVAETGDRMPPVHWGRVGDPIKPSMFDYYGTACYREQSEILGFPAADRYNRQGNGRN